MQGTKTALTYKTASRKMTHPGPHPTLLLLHGRGADENDLLSLADYLDPRLLIMSVQAPFPFSFGGYTWYEVLDVGKPEPKQFAESYDRLVQFLAEIKTSFSIDASRFFLLGFSMGAMMSYALALTKPGEIRGVIAHSGYIPEETYLQFRWNELDKTSFFVAHGTHDPVIPLQMGRRSRELLSKVQADVTYREYPIAHHMSEESLRDLSLWLKDRIEDDAS